MRGAEEEEDSDEKDRGRRWNGEEEEGNGEEEEGNGEKLKEDTKRLWQLRVAWKKAECETTRIEVGIFTEVLISELHPFGS